MAHRIEIAQTTPDTRAEVRKERFVSIDFFGSVRDVKLVDVYTLEGDFEKEELERVQSILANPVFQEGRVDEAFIPEFDYAV